MSRPCIPELYGDGERRLLGAVFLTYTLRVSAFEDILLRRLLGYRGDASSAAFAIEARSRLREVPIAIAADAAQLEKNGAGAFAGRCRVPVVRVQNKSGAFHPKLAVLRFDDGVRVVVGSANLTEDGLARQIEIGTSIELKAYPCLVTPLRKLLRGISARVGRSPAWQDAASVVEAGFPASSKPTPDLRLLSSQDGSILDQMLESVSNDCGTNTRIESIEITSPYFERGVQEDTLLAVLDAKVRKVFPRSRHIEFSVTLPTESDRAPYYVEAPISRFVEFASQPTDARRTNRLRFTVLAPADRRWLQEDGDAEDLRPRRLHGKLLVVTVRSKRTRSVYVLSGSPNFTKAALLGANDELALLTRHARRPPGIVLPTPGTPATLDDLKVLVAEMTRPPRDTAFIDRVVYSVERGALDVLLEPGTPGRKLLPLRYDGKLLAPHTSKDGWVVSPFDLGISRVLEVRSNGRWHELPIEVDGDEELLENEGRPPTTDELLARAVDPDVAPPRPPEPGQDGAGTGADKRSAEPAARRPTVMLASLEDVAPRLPGFARLSAALEAALLDARTGREARARLRTMFEPALAALVAEALGEGGEATSASIAFVLCDALRSLDRLVAARAGELKREFEAGRIRLSKMLSRLTKARREGTAPVLVAFGRRSA